MNKRIQDLVDITAEAVPGVYSLKYESGDSGVEFDETALQKFVELIVIDCMNAIRQEWFEENNTVPDQDARSIAIHLGKKLGIEAALFSVTEHFGVEE